MRNSIMISILRPPKTGRFVLSVAKNPFEKVRSRPNDQAGAENAGEWV